MRWSVSTSLLVAVLFGNVFAGLHHYHAHHHRHHMRQHAPKLESRDTAQSNAENSVEDIMVVSTTLTTTTTVYGGCVPTNTIFTTLTIVETRPIQTTDNIKYPVNELTPPQQPQPTHPELSTQELEDPEPTWTIFKTKTIHKTATETVVVTVHPGASAVPTPETPSDPLLGVGKVLSLADTLPKDSLSEEKAVPAKGPPAPPPPKDNDNPVNAVLDLPGEVLPNLPLVGQLLPGSKPKPNPPSPVDWTAVPPKGKFSFNGFGERTPPHGTGIHYRGNLGKPWGSNIITVSEFAAHRYKYVARFSGAKDKPWTVVVWNKFGPDGKMTGWYGHSAVTFTLAPGESRYVAFDEDSEGAWGAAPGDHLPTDHWGGYSCTWGEFSFGDAENHGWSGWDVSAIQAQIAKQHVQGMSICQANGKGCSVITPDAKRVVDAYTESKKHKDGIGGAAAPGPVRLNVLLDYRG